MSCQKLLMNTLLFEAIKALRSGLSLIPVLRDGSKIPMLKWKRFQLDAPSEDEVQEWIDHRGAAIGLVTGFAGVGVIDIDNDTLVEEFTLRVSGAAPGLIERLLQVETPRPGLHLIFKCPGGLERSQRLAGRRLGDGRVATLIETREIGSYVVFAYSPADVHSKRTPYKVIEGNYDNIQSISPRERQLLIDVARTFDEVDVEPRQRSNLRAMRCVTNPIVQEFNATTDWSFIEEFGWKYLKSNGSVELWQKPNSSNGGHHATINFGDSDLLFVFSTSAEPFEEGCSYTKFEAYCHLRHGGDYGAAVNELFSDGYVLRQSNQ